MEAGWPERAHIWQIALSGYLSDTEFVPGVHHAASGDLVLMVSLGDELKRDGNHLSLVWIPMPATGKDSQYIFFEWKIINAVDWSSSQ